MLPRRYSTDWTGLSVEPDEDTLTRAEAMARPMVTDEPEPSRSGLSLIPVPEPWREHAACRGMSPNLFHPSRGQNTDTEAAKAICATCPVTDECLDYALVNCEMIGVWGGTSERERRAIRRKGRPVVCVVCEQRFTTFGTSRAKFCSSECRTVGKMQDVRLRNTAAAARYRMGKAAG
jgi:WhiB family redox-sensing transcriptional regulator